jgi:hypothetical protein
MLPPALVAKAIDRQLRAAAAEDFSDNYKAGDAIVPQVEAFSAKQNIELSSGWKVDTARLVKQRLLKDGFSDDDFLARWKGLFERIEA